MTPAIYEIKDDTPMPFGRYMGRPMSAVPAIYLVWLYDNHCRHDGVRRYITRNLDGLKKRADSVPKKRR